MKKYFKDDPVKQEMLEAFIKIYYHEKKCEKICPNTAKGCEYEYYHWCNVPICIGIIEKVTGKKIEEVLK